MSEGYRLIKVSAIRPKAGPATDISFAISLQNCFFYPQSKRACLQNGSAPIQDLREREQLGGVLPWLLDEDGYDAKSEKDHFVAKCQLDQYHYLKAQTRLPAVEEFPNKAMNSMALIDFSSNESSTSVTLSNSDRGSSLRNLPSS